MIVEAESAAAGVDALFKPVKPMARVVMPLETQFYGSPSSRSRIPTTTSSTQRTGSWREAI
jgi:hypothetical protein